ncbi:hypothetical protein COHA_003737 [Chlorella ohadii]|uniref:Mannose-P-dolichol utilization defect 1 protein homolog n=1 Tax=Chlorella ohadii TaxID=2649997 RepID=A0AAD5DUA5_9CHLO|nr:hypothetical protein COHA_003737 [Chlorella ohadii]
MATAATAAAAAAAPAGGSLAAKLAVVVGWLVIAGSCIRSLPQILRILKNKSVRGLSLTSFSSELFCYMVSVAYNVTHGYAFSTFGDTAICALQNAAIIGLIFRLGTVARGTQLAVSAALAAAGWWLFAGGCPPAVLTALQTGSVALLALGGRLPQILLNLRRGNSGELSLGTCALSFVGNLARVFTTATLVKDPLILGSAAVQAGGGEACASDGCPGALLNGILVWQCVQTARQLRPGGGTLQAA